MPGLADRAAAVSLLKSQGPGWLQPLVAETAAATPPELRWLFRDLASSSPGYGIIRSAGPDGIPGALSESSLYATLTVVSQGKLLALSGFLSKLFLTFHTPSVFCSRRTADG